ncbi:SUMF1/EgtB/PvdO family nonheme iron enzyme [Mastigocoleus sp. MO_188.B34]|uniref:SUMF1/EgtB/PvdO family nonheme iron enzyme n=1 Tax=Mastigocoleus sp. MO_188.B34 TaxID=3036635 RepID=UPI00261C84CA|nr:SUMF1/EgtB/PvdO family nonheme iron enzyme [Mastigocoleus sp. MO_188.B34]MDJ0694964.1 SUMF1/EgtB/PvdO family nonheme iron enzyme [Mastigocoleus sp. MO_188.B34]
MPLSNSEHKKFYEALLDAFPEYTDLEIMVKFELGENLRVIVNENRLKNVVFKLIQWSETYGRLEDLITGAYEQNGGNPKLKAFYQSYQKKVSPPIASDNKTTPTLIFPKSNIPGNTSSNPIQLKTVKFQTPTVNRRGEIIKREPKTAQYFTENLPNKTFLDMVYIPGGKFMMGSLEGEGYVNEEPQHEVTVPAFFMGKYLVTQAQWEAVANLPQVEKELKLEPSSFKGDMLPVEHVSWLDAVEFCKRLSNHTGREYRLPCEAEWEYACRSGTKTPFHVGETITHKLANYDASYTFADEQKGEYSSSATPVGKFPDNSFYLCDVHGNIWEWCIDEYSENYEVAPIDGSPLISNLNVNNYRVLRGGSWYCDPQDCRCARRSYGVPDDIDDSVGFRVVCVVSPRALT